MNGSIPEEKIDEIRRRADVVSLIGEYVTLRKAGRNYLGLCPFHQEKTPSFSVNPEKQMFYCYGCHEGGNVFSFLMKLNHITFPEAVRELARKVGVVIPERPLNPQEREQRSLRDHIRRANGLAADFFVQQLEGPTGQGARDYLRKRGIGDTAIRTFRLGLAPEGWRNLFAFLERNGVSAEVAEKAGLIVARSGQPGYYDRFRERLMIPIEDVEGRVIAFGGRLLGPGEPKYLNSPESPLYTKGNNLYGLSRTREAIREKGFVILVEGYFDLIALWNAGITNVVATLGTALTRAQVDMIRRYVTRVAAIFDPDEAGRKALARSLELFLAGHVHARAVILPEGVDPDDFVRTRGREKMAEAIAQALPMADYYMNEVLGGRGTLEEERDKLRDAVAFIGRIDDAVERNLFIKKVSEALRVDQEVLKKEVQRLLSGSGAKAVEPIPGPAVQVLDPLELELIRMMLEHPDRIPLAVEDALPCFRTEGLRALGEAILAARREKGLSQSDAASLVDLLADAGLREHLMARLVQESPYAEEMMERLFADTILRIRQKWFRARQRLLQQKMNQAQQCGDRALCDALLAEKTRLLREETDRGGPGIRGLP